MVNNANFPDDIIYKMAKTAQPNAILFRLNEMAFEAYGDDAIIVARVFNSPITDNPQGLKCVAFSGMDFVEVKLSLEERRFDVGMVSGGEPCPKTIENAHIYPRPCFIQLGFADMPSYTPTDSVLNDPLEMYGNFISDDKATLEADIEDTKEEYRLQIKAGDRQEGDAPDFEYVSVCILLADCSIQIGERNITKSDIFQHFGMDETDGAP